MTGLADIAFSPKPRSIACSPCALAKTLGFLRVVLIGHDVSDAQTSGGIIIPRELFANADSGVSTPEIWSCRLQVRPRNL